MAKPDPDAVIRDVGRVVAELRAERGLTKADFAEALGIAAKHLQKIELGQLNMTIRTLTKLAHQLDVPIARLFAAVVANSAARTPAA